MVKVVLISRPSILFFGFSGWPESLAIVGRRSMVLVRELLVVPAGMRPGPQMIRNSDFIGMKTIFVGRENDMAVHTYPFGVASR